MFKITTEWQNHIALWIVERLMKSNPPRNSVRGKVLRYLAVKIQKFETVRYGGPANKEYICAECGGIFLTDWSDKDAMDEAREIWGQELYETRISIICDNCFNKLHKNVLNHLEERSSKSKIKP